MSSFKLDLPSNDKCRIFTTITAQDIQQLHSILKLEDKDQQALAWKNWLQTDNDETQQLKLWITLSMVVSQNTPFEKRSVTTPLKNEIMRALGSNTKIYPRCWERVMFDHRSVDWVAEYVKNSFSTFILQAGAHANFQSIERILHSAGCTYDTDILELDDLHEHVKKVPYTMWMMQHLWESQIRYTKALSVNIVSHGWESVPDAQWTTWFNNVTGLSDTLTCVNPNLRKIARAEWKKKTWRSLSCYPPVQQSCLDMIWDHNLYDADAIQLLKTSNALMPLTAWMLSAQKTLEARAKNTYATSNASLHLKLINVSNAWRTHETATQMKKAHPILYYTPEWKEIDLAFALHVADAWKTKFKQSQSYFMQFPEYDEKSIQLAFQEMQHKNPSLRHTQHISMDHWIQSLRIIEDIQGNPSVLLPQACSGLGPHKNTTLDLSTLDL